MRIFITILVLALLTACASQEPLLKADERIYTEDGAALKAEQFIRSMPMFSQNMGHNLKLEFSSPSDCEDCYIFVYEFMHYPDGAPIKVTMAIQTSQYNITGYEVSRVEKMVIPDKDIPRPVIPPKVEQSTTPFEELEFPNAVQAIMDDDDQLTADDITFIRRTTYHSQGFVLEKYLVKSESGYKIVEITLSNQRVDDITYITAEEDPAMLHCYETDGAYISFMGEDTCIYDNGFTCTDKEFETDNC